MAAKHHVTVDADVKGVLNRSRIEGSLLFLPDEQLDRALYVKVNKVLETAGGKWKRAKKAHEFPSDPTEILGLAMETGGILDTKKAEQQFFTPEPLARHLVSLAGIILGHNVLEPSAGEGAIAKVMRNYTPFVTCVEKDPKYVSILRGLGLKTVLEDFLQMPVVAGMFDRIVMNPPFTGGQDIDHFNHAFGMLKVDGIIVCVMGAGVKTNSHKKAVAFRELVQNHGGMILDLPDESFKESGTMVRTVAVVVTKHE